MELDVLAFGAHRDDVELTCGGTMIKLADQGYETGIIDLTAGEMGTRGSEEERAQEAAESAKILCVQYRENLGIPDAYIEHGKPAEMLEECGLTETGIQASIEQRLQKIENRPLVNTTG